VTEYLPNGRPIPKRKKRPLAAAPKQKVVPRQNLDRLYEQRMGTSAFPFRDKGGAKYAGESKRLVDSLGIRVQGIDGHPDPNAVYTAIGRALHRLPSVVWPWLQEHGQRVKFKVTPDGTFAYDTSGTSDKPRAAGLFWDNNRITVGVPNDPMMFQDQKFTPPIGGETSGREITMERVTDIATHEFAHWLDKATDQISSKHAELFGNQKSHMAPHDERQWERFAGDFSAYLGSENQRRLLDTNVRKFFDRFVGPKLSMDSTGPGRKTAQNARDQLALARRVAAIKTLHRERKLIPNMSLMDFEFLLEITEKQMEEMELRRPTLKRSTPRPQDQLFRRTGRSGALGQ